jgi:pimeloyl-ACP methyl ester carboxylesterase
MSHERYLAPELRTAVVGGRCQSWRQAGGGERLPLVFLHGIGSNARAWAGQLAGFAPERPVIAWNAPGYAQSDPLETAWPAADDYALAALALFDHLGIRRCALIGQSLGAIMATAVARRAPQRVAALVLVSPASGYGIATGSELPEPVASRLAELERLGPVTFAALRSDRLLTDEASSESRSIVRRAMSEITLEGYSAAARMLACADLEREVAALCVPVLVIWGNQDEITPPAGCRRVAKAASAAEVELPGLGHALATEAPERLNEVIRPLLVRAEESRELWI